MPRLCVAQLASVSPVNQSRCHETPKLPGENHGDYEVRTWREKAHYDPKTKEVFIPPMAFKIGLDDAAKMLSIKIPGGKNATYTKFFASGVLVMDPVFVGITVDKTEECRIHANADGVRGSGTRVWRSFPRIPSWSAAVEFHVLADEITEEVFERVLKQAGAFIGIGQFRPQKGGYYGRYKVLSTQWYSE